jgi:hypothetical protein
MYGSENRKYNKKSYERKIIRILGSINDNGTWRIRYNKEIYPSYGDSELSTVIKLRRLQWAGPVGKPKRRLDAVKEDNYQILNWRNLEVKARGRDEWRSRIKKAKARFGL